jgi:hypothetical protein
MEDNRARWDRALNALEAFYKDVERRSLWLPAFSLFPFAICFWNTIKFEVCFVLDIFLLLPMNAIIFVRNLFPGRWLYRSFSGSYWRYVISWLWRGEAPMAPLGVIRPLVIFMVIVHVHSRFRTIGRHIYLDDTLTEEDRTYLDGKVARASEHWRRPTGIQVVYSYVLPAAGPVIGLYRYLFPGELPQWIGFVGVVLVSYAIAFVVSAFMLKRSLMLGASGRSIYFPGAISGNQGYGKESDILDSVGIKLREWPFDIALAFVSIAFGYLSIPAFSSFYELVGVPMPSGLIRVQILVQGAPVVMLNVLAVYRRRMTSRS